MPSNCMEALMIRKAAAVKIAPHLGTAARLCEA
jgi:hypothetical protein